MNPHRTCQENMDALKKVLTQRTLLALSRRNVEFVLAHQADSKQQLADYLRQCRAELGHIPGRTEVIGGDLIELRFRGWANALCASGVPAEQAVRRTGRLPTPGIWNRRSRTSSGARPDDRAASRRSAGADTYENSIRSFCGNCATRGDPDTQILFC